MTPAEKALAARLLRLAADQFDNHGCNDFDLAAHLSAAERDALVIEACGELYYEAAEPDYRLGDSILMNLMADRLEAEDEPVGEPEGGWCFRCAQAGHTDEDPHVTRIRGRAVVSEYEPRGLR